MRVTRLAWVMVLGAGFACGDPGPGGSPGTIAGQVWAPSVEGDSVPLAGASVLATRTFCGVGALCVITAQTTTDAVGHYLLTVPPDQYSVAVNPPTNLALQSASNAVSVSAGQAVTWSVVLARAN